MLLVLSILYLVSVGQAVKVARMECENDKLITSLVDNERSLGHSASVVVEEDHAKTTDNASTIISRKVLIGCGAVAVGTVVATSVALTGGDSKSSNSCQDVVITPGSEVSQCPVIGGNLIISNDLQGEFELDNYLPNLERVEGNVELVATSLTSFEFKHQEGFMKLQDDHTSIEVGGDIHVFLNPSLEHVDLSDVTSIENSLVIDRNAALSGVNFLGDKNLVIENNVEVKNNPMLESLELATTQFIGGLLEVESNENMQIINFLALQAVGFIVLSESPSLQNFCTESAGCFPASELPEQAAQGNVNVLDSVQLCEVTEVVAGEPFCVTTDPVTNEPINCPLFDYLNEPTDRSCADFVNENAAAGCENYDQETLECSQVLPPEPSTPPPTTFEPLCRQGQTNFCEFYQFWFIENGENRQCNTYDSSRGSCTCMLGGNPFIRVNVGEAVCVQGQCDQFCDLTRSSQHALCATEEIYCAWIGLSVCNYQAMCLDDYCAPRCTYPEMEWPDTLAPTPMPPTSAPSLSPTAEPTIDPSSVPTSMPSYEPTSLTDAPSAVPSAEPTINPSSAPTSNPTYEPTSVTDVPSSSPTNQPTPRPTDEPTAKPTGSPSSSPTYDPTASTNMPTPHPTVGPTASPSSEPTSEPTLPTAAPSPTPTGQPTLEPTVGPTVFSFTNENINDAISLWCEDPNTAEEMYGHIKDWATSQVTDLSGAFQGYEEFNDDISVWDISRVTTLDRTFRDARSFNAGISKWDVSSVETMRSTFDDAFDFNADISQWDVSSATALCGTFWGADSFNADVSVWDVSRVTRLDTTFTCAFVFYRDLTPWDVSRVTHMYDIFWPWTPAQAIPLSGTWCDNAAAQEEASRGELTLSCSFKAEEESLMLAGNITAETS